MLQKKNEITHKVDFYYAKKWSANSWIFRLLEIKFVIVIWSATIMANNFDVLTYF